MIITPAYSHAHHDLHAAVRESGIPWCVLYGHSDLVRCRSVLLSHALATGAERLILVDADVVPAPGVLQALATSAAVTPDRALFGLYPQRGAERWQVHAVDPASAERSIRAGGPFPIAWGGLGLCCVHRGSLERVEQTLPVIAEDLEWRPYCIPFIRDGVYLAEDRAFCQRLVDCGVELQADASLIGAHAFTTLVSALVTS